MKDKIIVEVKESDLLIAENWIKIDDIIKSNLEWEEFFKGRKFVILDSDHELMNEANKGERFMLIARYKKALEIQKKLFT